MLGVYQQDVGGPFNSKKTYFESIPQYYSLRRRNATSGATVYLDQGPMVASDEISRILRETLDDKTEDSSLETLSKYCPADIETTSLDAAGATAVDRSTPTNPLTDASVSLAELMREGPPITGRSLGDMFNPGSLYLNYQFGVAPTASDYSALREALRTADAHLNKLGEHSGQLLRRRYDFEPLTNVTHKVVSGTYPVFADGRIPQTLLVDPGTRTEVVKTTTSLWWSGAFKYYVPEMGPLRAKISELEHAYGAVPDANTLYNLTPWSWLVDYYANVGTIVKNLTSFVEDSLVMPWSYIMATQETEVTHSWVGNLRIENVPTRSTIETRYRATTLQRRRASPYGFGFDDDGLTDRQKLILAALGISRV